MSPVRKDRPSWGRLSQRLASLMNRKIRREEQNDSDCTSDFFDYVFDGETPYLVTTEEDLIDPLVTPKMVGRIVFNPEDPQWHMLSEDSIEDSLDRGDPNSECYDPAFDPRCHDQ